MMRGIFQAKQIKKAHRRKVAAGFLIPIAVLVLVGCCIRRRCKKRCEEYRRRRAEQQAALLANGSPLSGAQPQEGYPGAVAVTVASSSAAPVALPVAVASPAPVAPVLYSHDPQPIMYRPVDSSSEVEMRPLATPTAVMYPVVSGNGYARVGSSEV